VDDDIDILHRVDAVLPLPEIGVPAAGDPDLVAVHFPFRELLEHVRPQEPGTTGEEDALVIPECHRNTFENAERTSSQPLRGIERPCI
jgi:hypothetical protein